MRRVSKGLFVSLMGVAFGLILALGLIGRLAIEGGAGGEAGFVLVLLVVPLSLGLLALYAVFVYKIWAAIQDGQARTTPGKAAGFMFIPLFNWYWRFQAVWGFAKDYNQYVQRRGMSLQKLPEGLFLAEAILPIVAIIAAFLPYVGQVVGAASMIVTLIVVWKSADAVNALPASPGGPSAA